MKQRGSQDPDSEPAPYPVGRIVGGFGLKGEIKVEPLTDFIERLQKGARLLLRGNWVDVRSFRMHKGRPLLTVTGVDSLTAAEDLKWEVLQSISQEQPRLEDDEFFTQDLIGLSVHTTEGQELGEVDDVLVTPAHDILQVGTVLIPAIKEFVKDVDLDSGVILVQLIPGMLPD